MRLAKLLVILLCLKISVGLAYTEPYPFEKDKDAKRFEQLTKDFRCVTCQNQNLADSNAPIAESMRDAIYTQVKSGRKDSEIEQFLVARYGDFVLYNPPFKAETVVLWLGPLIFLLLALALGVRTFYKSA